MVEVTCAQCKIIFKKLKYYLKPNNFCSRNCHNCFQRENNGIEKNCKICGNIFKVPKCYFHRYSTCPNVECRKSNKLKQNNPNWRNSIRKRRDDSRKVYKQWRLTVLQRDNYRCILCGCDENLQVDHIKPYAYYPEFRYDISNGRVLCKLCHQNLMKDVFKIRKDLNIITRYKVDELKYEIRCSICNVDFTTHILHKKTCSRNCKRIYINNYAREYRKKNQT